MPSTAGAGPTSGASCVPCGRGGSAVPPWVRDLRPTGAVFRGASWTPARVLCAVPWCVLRRRAYRPGEDRLARSPAHPGPAGERKPRESVFLGLTSRSDHGTIIMQVATAWGSFNPELNTVKTGVALEQGRTVLKNQPVPVPPAVATCGGYCFFLPLCGREKSRGGVHTYDRSAALPGS